jgi:LEA14-like dessication related protein
LKNAIFWVVGGAAALYFIARYRFSQKANFLLRSVKPTGTILQPTVTVEIAVQNPTNQRIILKSISGSLFINDKYLANVSSFGDQIIAGNSESIVKVTARPSAVGVFQSVRELLSKPIGTMQVRFSGTANVDGINIPIDQTNTL